MVPIVPILGIAGKLLDKLFPDPQERAKAEATLQKAQVDGELAVIEQQLSAIIMEAKSQDKWTSRARPAFLYVVYIFILSALPFGVLFAINPETATSVTNGVQAWLAAIPDEVWTMFTMGYLGYVGGRTWEKRELIKKVK